MVHDFLHYSELSNKYWHHIELKHSQVDEFLQKTINQGTKTQNGRDETITERS